MKKIDSLFLSEIGGRPGEVHKKQGRHGRWRWMAGPRPPTGKGKPSKKSAVKRGAPARRTGASSQSSKRTTRRRISRRRHGRDTRLYHHSELPEKVSHLPDVVSSELAQRHPGGRPRGSGGIHLENTLKEQEALDVLLEPNVATYADAAKRPGITENAVKQRMGRVLFRYRKAKAYSNRFDQWRVKRRESREARIHRPRVPAPPAIAEPMLQEVPA